MQNVLHCRFLCVLINKNVFTLRGNSEGLP